MGALDGLGGGSGGGDIGASGSGGYINGGGPSGPSLAAPAQIIQVQEQAVSGSAQVAQGPAPIVRTVRLIEEAQAQGIKLFSIKS